MAYLYGDSTPFPLNENFLATLCAATDACVAILRADEQVDEVKRLVREAETKAESELIEIADLERVLARTFGVAERDGSAQRTHADAAFAKIAEHAWETVRAAREETSRDRDAAKVQATLLCPHSQVVPALSAFLSAHQLPETMWGIRWAAGLGSDPSKAELYARTPFGLGATFEVGIPVGHLYARPVKVEMLAKQSTIKLLRKPILRKPRPTPEPLDPMFVTAVLLTTERATLSLRKSESKPSEGIDFLLHDDGTVTATKVDKKGYPIAPDEKLVGDDAASARRIWTRVVATISNLLENRKRITTATFGGVPCSEVARPAAIAQAVIASIAPLVREIARRAGTPRELALKRVVADGCREELFVSYETVLERVRGLSPAGQSFFAEFGLRDYGMMAAPASVPMIAPVAAAQHGGAQQRATRPMSERPRSEPPMLDQPSAPTMPNAILAAVRAAPSTPPPAAAGPNAVVHRLPVVRPPRLKSGYPPPLPGSKQRATA